MIPLVLEALLWLIPVVAYLTVAGLIAEWIE